MRKVKVLFAIQDLLFCERIEEIVTDPEYFDYFHAKNKIDVLLITSAFLEKISLQDLVKEKTFILTQGSQGAHGLKTINPYQKTEAFLKEVLLRYSELTGEASFLQEEKGKKHIVCFFSPCGGSGKTTVSLALAEALANLGRNVFYLSIDGFSGTNLAFSEKEKGGFSRVLLSLKQLLVELSKNMKRAGGSQVLYFSDLENPCDLEEIEAEEIEILFKEMVKMKEIDILVIDAEPALTERTRKVLELADHIFLTTLDTSACQSKAEAWKEAVEVSAFLKPLRKKMMWVCNQKNGSLRYFKQFQEEILSIPLIMPLRGAIEINRIGELMRNEMSEMTTKVLEGSEEK